MERWGTSQSIESLHELFSDNDGTALTTTTKGYNFFYCLVLLLEPPVFYLPVDYFFLQSLVVFVCLFIFFALSFWLL